MSNNYPSSGNSSAIYTREEITEAISRIQKDYEKRLDILSHELKNTLSLTRLSLEFIEKMHPEVRQFYYWPQAMGDLTYLCRMLSEHKLYQASLSGTPEQFALNPFLEEIAAAGRAWGEHTKKQLQIMLPEASPYTYGDPLRLRQVLFNLIKNAFEAIPDDGSIILSLKLVKDQIHIHVADNGPGIPESCQSSLFSPYSTFKEDGTGLGLYTSRKIIEAMDGSLTCRSVSGKGTVFTICLPLASAYDTKQIQVKCQ